MSDCDNLSFKGKNRLYIKMAPGFFKIFFCNFIRIVAVCDNSGTYHIKLHFFIIQKSRTCTAGTDSRFNSMGFNSSNCRLKGRKLFFSKFNIFRAQTVRNCKMSTHSAKLKSAFFNQFCLSACFFRITAYSSHSGINGKVNLIIRITFPLLAFSNKPDVIFSKNQRSNLIFKKGRHFLRSTKTQKKNAAFNAIVAKLNSFFHSSNCNKGSPYILSKLSSKHSIMTITVGLYGNTELNVLFYIFSYLL